MRSLSSGLTKGKLAQTDAGEMFTIEVVLEYGVTVPTVQRSYGILMYIAAQRIVTSTVRKSGWI